MKDMPVWEWFRALIGAGASRQTSATPLPLDLVRVLVAEGHDPAATLLHSSKAADDYGRTYVCVVRPQKLVLEVRIDRPPGLGSDLVTILTLDPDAYEASLPADEASRLQSMFSSPLREAE